MKIRNIITSAALIPLWFSLSAQQITDTTKTIRLNEVYVHADRRTGNIKKFPISITKINSVVANRQRVDNIRDISVLVPNLFIPEFGNRLNAPVFIRGIGSRIGAPSVGLYVDGVAYFEKAAFDLDLYDIKSIEVLRGPQGTMYGRNSIGGVINIRTERIKYDPVYRAYVEYGSYNNIKVKALAGKPVTDNLTMSVSVGYNDRKGYFTNSFNGEDIDWIIGANGRIKLNYTPTDNYRSELTIYGDYSRQGGNPFAPVNPVNNKVGNISKDHEELYNRDMAGVSLKQEFMLGKRRLTSVTGYQFYDDIYDADQDNSALSLYYVKNYNKQHLITQEINIQPVNPGDIKWVAGVYGFLQWIDGNVDVYFDNDFIKQYNYPSLFQEYNSYDRFNYGAAGFAQVVYDNMFVNGLSATVGLRADYEQNIQDHISKQQFVFGDIPLKNNIDQKSDSEIKLLPKVSLRYALSDKISVYTTVAKGYKSGAFNQIYDSDTEIYYEPETSINYELGFKSSLFNSRLTASASLFFIKLDNQQVYMPVVNGFGRKIVNAAETESKGFEVEIKAIPVKNLVIMLNAGYTDTRFKRYLYGKGNNPATYSNFSNNYAPYVPKYTSLIGGSYRLPFKEAAISEINFNLNLKIIGEHYWNPSNSLKEEAYGLLNSKVSANINKFVVWLYAENITGTDYNAYMFESQGVFAQEGKPTIIGGGISVKF